MPHIILEYSSALEDKLDLPEILESLHNTLAEQGVDKARIKTRGVKLDHAVVDDQGTDGLMAHATLLLLEGRDVSTKQQYGQALHGVMKDKIISAAPECKLTLEVRDMEKDTYIL
ncbi:MAG: hypothetical protein AAF569_06000 [Pseudomonadota bacterium]